LKENSWRTSLGNAFAGGDLVVEIAQLADLQKEVHTSGLAEVAGGGK